VLIRVLIVAISIAAIWWPLRSFGLGLGLGEVSVESSLSSPLQLSIPLRGLDGFNLDPEEFSVVIEDASMPGINYRLENRDGDTATIVLYTRKTITEPVVHFRVEVKLDKSAVARRYDVFIDPPAYRFNPPAETVTPPLPAPVVEPAPEVIAEENIEPAFEPIAANFPVTVTEAEVDIGIETKTETDKNEDPASEFSSEIIEQRREYGPTIDGNSIWRVARAVATDNRELTIYQWMYGIWKANPRAFARSNMHRMNMQELLSIPLEREIADSAACCRTTRCCCRNYSRTRG
jgi:FimV-like protein